ncbi:hypothetical protein MGYG_02132 [Nannizzia gypsea CBS 118893]|uniref:Uncharacterized protein n=1 Tax=Arthroderma gypseum (strain ATCC MYA-4604 / CBS 118893) TaxID=535722 RepID=E4UPY6_ARTGP|nr:hypothetical protein MGYG_02132 [Nannizzia gypsea CBS 118893]EFQ99120.1 hypothetical protein MGYG_02132 [Nannizzia gypsea CBS 118893]
MAGRHFQIYVDPGCQPGNDSPQRPVSLPSRPTPAVAYNWDDPSEYQVPEVAPGRNFAERLVRSAEMSIQQHERDVAIFRVLCPTEIYYIGTMLLKIVQKLHLLEDEPVPLHALISEAEETKFDELNDYPVPVRYWGSIRGIRDYFREEEPDARFPDTAAHFATLLLRPDKRYLRLRWSGAFELAYGRSVLEMATTWQKELPNLLQIPSDDWMFGPNL